VKLLIAAVIGGLGCGAPAKPKPAPPVPVADIARTCLDAANGIERGTKGIRAPETTVVGAMRELCADDAWPAVAIECFARMTEDELVSCSGKLETADREHLFEQLDGGTQDEEALAAIVTKLGTLKVGVAECDRFVSAVASAMSCRGMPLADRIQLGNDTADFWSLPTDRLSTEAQLRMAAVCGKSLGQLQQRATAAGCMP
jgi:hypothetical protein